MTRSKISSPPSRRAWVDAETPGDSRAPRPFAIKTEISDPHAERFRFVAQKTMYGGRDIAEGDAIFLFASETEGGRGLVARGTVTSVSDVARQPDKARQTPRVTIEVRRTAKATRALGRRELKPFDVWDDGRPETELNFKFYRQATDKIIGLSMEAARYLGGFFENPKTD